MFKNAFGQVTSGYLIASATLIVFVGQGIFMMPGATLVSIIEISKNQSGIAVETNLEEMSPLFLILTQAAGTFGGLAATLVAFRAINKKNPNKLGIQGPAKDMLFGFILGEGVMTIIFFILLFTDQITLINDWSTLNFSSYILVFVVLFILTVFFDVFLFRGFVIQTLQ